MVAAIRVHDFAPGPNGCTLCGLERRNTAHWSEPVACDEPVAAGIFVSPIPGGTYCESCGRLRHTHVDGRCAAKPVRSKARRDESTEAQLAYALQCLASLVRHVRKVSGYAVPEDQEALREAEALLVEVGR